MRNISGSLTNQIADILYADNNTYIRKFDVFQGVFETTSEI